MAEKRRGLGRGIGALIPRDQEEKNERPIDVFFSSPQRHKKEDATTAAVRAMTEADAAETIVAGGDSDSQSKKQREEQAKREDSKKEQDKKATKNPRERQAHTADNAADDAPLVPVPGATFGELAITSIIPNTKQPRQVFDEDELQELADSIKEVGVLQPIVVRPLTTPHPENPEARYELIMGERRWRATRLAGVEKIPAIVRHTEDSDLLRDALLENLHRAQLNPLEEAAAYQQLLDDFHITHEELSKKIARSRPQISNTLRLLKLPPLVQRRVAAGVLSAGHARALLSLEDPAQMEQLAQRIVAEGLSVRAVEEIVSMGVSTQRRRAHAPRTSQYQEELAIVAQQLEDQLNTRVKIHMGAHKGRLSVEFAGIDDLNRILDEIGAQGVELSD
ncbi:MAG: ParB/RepB/Spo0J family partition protein [Actinomycetaceae bacterium]|nr:ParB/RepB/Spo0J family partition protein [Actinomycetaceae bacterium]MDY5273070.1 ParB/RepB/Spo0J family partition protein [Arcanobacterium sp.]